mmetsp:Transcript_9412/g.42681  ORF Transcript_9412/g.42681 Transcript_9412/m.42681 type:complete len:681 (-) Transcript_9412:754-2796(-)
MGGGGMGSRGGPAGPPTDETADLLALRKKLLEKKRRLDQMLRQSGGGTPTASTGGKNSGGRGSQRQQGARARGPNAMVRMESTPSFVPSIPDNGGIGAVATCACCVGANVCQFLPEVGGGVVSMARMSTGLNRSASAPPINRPAFSFDPEHDPVVSAMVQKAQAQAAARLKQTAMRAEQERSANETLRELTPAQLAARKHQEREQRLSAKRKFAELSCSIERVSAEAVRSAALRDELNDLCETAADDADDAETRRRTHLAGRSVRESAPGRVARNGGAPPPFDSAAFAAVAAKRKVEIVNRQCLAALKQVMSHKWAGPFLKPVDHVALNLPTYPQIVTRPMDLGTVEANIRAGGVYGCAEEVHGDVSQVFINAKTFTPKPEMDVHVMAVALEQFWAQRWDTIQERAREVEEGMSVEKECAEKKSAEMNARKRLAGEEMRCAGLMADLDSLRRQLDDLKRQTRSICAPMTTVEKDALRRHLTNLPDCYRQDVRDMIAETEGAHKVPVDGVENWAEIVEEFNEFGPVAHRRLARFVKVRRRNNDLITAGKAPRPAGGFDADTWEEWDVPPPKDPKNEEEEEDAKKAVEAPKDMDDAMAAAAAAAAAAAERFKRRGATLATDVDPTPARARRVWRFRHTGDDAGRHTSSGVQERALHVRRVFGQRVLRVSVEVSNSVQFCAGV